MICAGTDVKESVRSGREMCVDGERVGAVAGHPMVRPLGAFRAATRSDSETSRRLATRASTVPAPAAAEQ